MGSWPVVPSPLGARLCSGTEDNEELSWHCHPSAAPCQEQTGNKGSAIGECWDPSLLFALDTADPGGTSFLLASAAPNLTGTHRDQTCFFCFYFWPPGRWQRGGPSGTGNSSVPMGVLRCNRA